jgi:type I restriction enzyme S subunit
MKTETKNTKAFYNNKIPSDWELKKFGSFANFFSGGTPLTTNPEYYKGTIPFIKSGEIYFDETEQFISEEGLNNSSAKMIDEGDLLYALYGANSGEVAISKLNGAINQAILCIRHNEECDTVFIYNFLLSQKESIIRTYLQGGQGNLSAEIVKNLVIPLPPLPEQKAIAQVLSTADAAINTNEKLIAQKELRKKWLMQQLLTGKKRLKGFDGEWKEKRLGDLLKEREIKSDISNEFEILTSSRKGLFYQKDYFNKQVASENNEGYKVIQIGDFTYRSMSDDNTFVFNQLDFTEKGLISPAYSVFYANNINDKFLLYLLNDHSFKRYINREIQGGTRTAFRFSSLKEILLPIPLNAEQTAIAHVLQTADREISLLQAKAEKLREQKKGLMQVLLTGKVRLKIKE